jgi:hypothetical protein
MSGSGTSARGQSEVIAVVLLLGLSIAGATGIVLLGTAALDDARGEATDGAAEHSMTQLDSKASLVAHGGSDAQRVRLTGADRADRTVDPSAGRINVTVRNTTTGEVREVLLDRPLGAVVYEHRNTTITYQGGGVWAGKDNASRMVSAPEFHYRGNTLTLPLIVVAGGTGGDDVRIRQVGDTDPVYPDATATPPLSNPLGDDRVVVEVQSDYYPAWGRFFDERTGGDSEIDHGNRTAVIELVTVENTREVDAGLATTDAGDELKLSGGGSDPAFVDSYNSSQGDYAATATSDGVVEASADVTISGNAEIQGDVRSGGVASLDSSNAEVTGEVAWTENFQQNPNANYGSERQIDGVDGASSVDGYVENKIDTLEDNNDNAGTPADGESVTFTSGTATLTAGDYYIDGPDMDGDELTLDTSGGDIDIAIDGDLHLDNAARIDVTGDGVVRIYLGDDFDLDTGSEVHVPDENSKQLWLYGSDDLDATMEASSGNPVRFVGVIYAPNDEDTSASLQHGDAYGAMIAAEVEIGSGGTVHYDRALRQETVIPTNEDVPRVTYLHVSVSRVELESAT